MSPGVGRVKGDGLAEFGFRFFHEPLGQKFVPALDMELSMAASVRAGEFLLIGGLEREGHLAEGTLAVVGFDSLEGEFEFLGWGMSGGLGGNFLLQSEGLGVGRAKGKGLPHGTACTR